MAPGMTIHGCAPCRAAGGQRTFVELGDLLQHLYDDHRPLVHYVAGGPPITCATDGCAGPQERRCLVYYDIWPTAKDVCVGCAKSLVDRGRHVEVMPLPAGRGE